MRRMERKRSIAHCPAPRRILEQRRDGRDERLRVCDFDCGPRRERLLGGVGEIEHVRPDESRKSQACTAGCANNGRYLLYVYTRTAIEGTARFDASAVPGTYTWPLKPGSYEIRLLVDDSYRTAGSSATFKVVKP